MVSIRQVCLITYQPKPEYTQEEHLPQHVNTVALPKQIVSCNDQESWVLVERFIVPTGRAGSGRTWMHMADTCGRSILSFVQVGLGQGSGPTAYHTHITWFFRRNHIENDHLCKLKRLKNIEGLIIQTIGPMKNGIPGQSIFRQTPSPTDNWLTLDYCKTSKANLCLLAQKDKNI